MNAKRGYVPDDDRNFSPEAIQIMRTASRHISYLLDEGYDLKTATVFVGNHFLLSERQRLAVMRSVAARQQLSERKRKQVPVNRLEKQRIWIDGFNTIITLEVLLCDSLLFECMDGTLRDLASLRGTYRLIPETAPAVKLMLDVLQEAGAGEINVLLDEPVSNSGRLKALIADVAQAGRFAGRFTFDLDIRILRDVDRTLYQKDFVATSDSVILDQCISWVNLAAECQKRTGKNAIKVW